MQLCLSPSTSTSSGDSPPSSKARRLSSKQRCDALVPPQPQLPLLGDMWKQVKQEDFDAMHKRSQYKLVYNKFWWWFSRDPQVEFPADSVCTAELWALAKGQYDQLNKFQRNRILRFFLHATHAPEFLIVFAQQQWLVSAIEKDNGAYFSMQLQSC